MVRDHRAGADRRLDGGGSVRAAASTLSTNGTVVGTSEYPAEETLGWVGPATRVRGDHSEVKDGPAGGSSFEDDFGSLVEGAWYSL